MSFWGLVLEPKKQYSQTVEQPFHISMAALDLGSSDAGEECSSVVLRREGGDFILCNLSRKHKLLNSALNLAFEVGEEINFHVNGNSNIHLTGYIGDDPMEGLDSDLSGEEEEEDEEEETGRSPLLKSTKKLLEKAVKRKADTAKANESKKSKLVEIEEDSDDSDIDFDSDLEEEEDDDDDDDDDIEDDEVDSEDEDPEAILNKIAAAKNKEKSGNKGTLKVVEKPNAQQQGGKGSNLSQGQAKANKNKQKQQMSSSPNISKQEKPTNEKSKANGVVKKFNDGGVFIEDLHIGTGATAKPGKMVTVYYVGRLKNSNRQFDASQKGPGFQFRLGRGEVIKGWDIGVKGMHVGGKRRLTIPPKLGYGSQGSPPVIPPNSPLLFEIELKAVR